MLEDDSGANSEHTNNGSDTGDDVGVTQGEEEITEGENDKTSGWITVGKKKRRKDENSDYGENGKEKNERIGEKG